MKTVLLLSARSGSKRLPHKHFLQLSNEFTALDVLSKRLRKMLPSSEVTICVATTTKVEDQVFEMKLPEGISIFKGSPDNIPLRQYEAAKSLGAELIVSIDGDDVFTSPEGVKLLIEKYSQTKDADQKYFYTVGLPFGMNVSCYSTSLLGSLIKGQEKSKLETGWGRIFLSQNRVEVPCHLAEFPEKLLRFTLDYPEDLTFFSKILEHFQANIVDASTASIINYVVTNKIYKINETVIEKYWENFNREKGLEENASK